MHIPKRAAPVAVLALVAASLLGTGVAAHADSPAPLPDPKAPPGYSIWYYVVNSSSVGNYVNTGDIISRCYATGGTCTIASGHTSTIDIGLSLGMSRFAVASGLSISSSSSTSISVGCTSPTLRSGQSWTAYPIGRYYSYQVREDIHAGIYVTTSYSGILHAFVPYSNQMACRAS